MKEPNKIINIAVSNTGIPCLWEFGGKKYNSNSSYVILITDKFGDMKSSIFDKNEPNGKHALIPISVNDYTIETYMLKDGSIITNIWRIEQIDKNKNEAKLSIQNNFSNGVWDDLENRKLLSEGIMAAIGKVNTVNCRNSVYCIKREKNVKTNKHP